MKNITDCQTARMVTLNHLLENVLPLYLNPLPTAETLRNWLNNARVPCFKSNPTARRGGGPAYYSRAGVERFLRTRTLPFGKDGAL